MCRLAITGSKGTIGTVLRRGLTDYTITPIDLPEIDVRDYHQLMNAFLGHDVVVHLAWNPDAQRFSGCDLNPDNILMICNVYKAALESGVSRVIMASSVHADSYLAWRGPGFLTPGRTPVPDGPYGASKVFMEALGRHYSAQGLEVVCVRFGGVNSEDKTDIGEEGYKKVWLSHRDCVALLRACIETTAIPDNFTIVYGVSNNTQRVHDYSNPLGWLPQDDAHIRDH